MALLAEEIIEEWLNRQGYFTIRGIKLGVHEMDLLAVRRLGSGATECRHVEVQASMRPVSYISRVPKESQRGGRAPHSAKKRSDQEIAEGVAEWVHQKYHLPQKKKMMAALWPGTWSSELVVNIVKHEQELEFIAAQGIKILRLSEIVSSFSQGRFVVPSACGADIVDLIRMSSGADELE